MARVRALPAASAVPPHCADELSTVASLSLSSRVAPAGTEFDGTTLLTIAHRLQTVIDYDTILVLGRGQLIEQGTPLELLAEPAGALSSMVKALGEAGEAELRRKAGDGTAVSVAGS